MIKSYKLFFICLILMVCFTETKATEKITKLYVYGCSASFNDSTIYFTDIIELDSAWINTKTKFLYGRENYSLQLKNYMQEQGVSTPTCIVSSAETRKDAEKKYIRLRDKYTNKKEGNYTVKYIGVKDFRFKEVSAEGDPNVTTFTSKAAEKAQKKALKTQKKLKSLAEKQEKNQKKSDTKTLNSGHK